MLLTESFNLQLDDLLHRLCVNLQITADQHRRAAERYDAIGRWLEADGSILQLYTPHIYPQGSLLIGTTVRPIYKQEFDLDLVCELRIDTGQLRNPIILLDAIENRLREHETYRGMIERRNRCVAVQYSDEFHLDILPACPDPNAPAGCLLVPDRKEAEWKPSNPKGFAAWFEAQANRFPTRVVEKIEPLPTQELLDVKPPLKRVVQLMKRWRDVRYARTRDLAPISIVLTTLAGTYYSSEPSLNETLTNILARIAQDLPPQGRRILVLNPTNRKEDLSERWDDNPQAYDAFVAGIRAFREAWAAVQETRGFDRLSHSLGELFGPDVVKKAIKEHANPVQAAHSRGMLGSKSGSGMLGSVLSPGFTQVPRNTFYGGDGK